MTDDWVLGGFAIAICASTAIFLAIIFYYTFVRPSHMHPHDRLALPLHNRTYREARHDPASRTAVAEHTLLTHLSGGYGAVEENNHHVKEQVDAIYGRNDQRAAAGGQELYVVNNSTFHNCFVINTWCCPQFVVESLSEFCSVRGSTLHKVVVTLATIVSVLGMAGAAIRIAQTGGGDAQTGWILVLVGFFCALWVGYLEVGTYDAYDKIHIFMTIAFLVLVHVGMLMIDSSHLNIAVASIGFAMLIIYAIFLRGLLHLGRPTGRFCGLNLGPARTRIFYSANLERRRRLISWLFIYTEAAALVTPIIVVANNWLL